MKRVLLIAMAVVGCAPAGNPQCNTPREPVPEVDGTCPEGHITDADRSCGLYPDGGGDCGDIASSGVCRKLCESDADCGCGERCQTVGYYNGGDYTCNRVERVCGIGADACH